MAGAVTQLQAVAVRFLAENVGVVGQEQSFGLIDSSNVTTPRIDTAAQRGPSTDDICDIQGFMYDTNGETISVDGIDYSTVGPGGPWTAGTIVWSDPLTIWLSTGSPAGTPFFLVASFFPGPIAGTCWIRMRVSWP